MHPLILMIAVPAVAGAALLALPERAKAAARYLGVAGAAAAFAGAVYAFARAGVSWGVAGGPAVLRADSLSGFIGLAVAGSSLLVACYSCGSVRTAVCRYFGLLLITLGAALAVAYANHLIVLLVSWGTLAVTLFCMVNLSGSAGSSRAARKALVIIGGTDALLMFGAGLAWMLAGSFAIDRIRLDLGNPLAYAAYLSLAIAAFAKAGAMPFHAWLPDVAENAPVPVTAYLPASLDKLLGIYLLARASLDIFVMTPVTNLLLLAVGAVTIVVAVMMALAQHDMKRLLGYHAVSQVGYMVLGIGTGNPIGIAGSLFHMLNNAVYKSCLFMTAGSVEREAGTTDLDRLGGLWRAMPLTFAACLVAALSISGVPPFNGFVSKWMIYQGVIESAARQSPLWVVYLAAAMFGSALTVASFMKLLYAAFLGRGERDWKDVREAPPSMTAPAIVLAALCAIFGVFAMALPLPLFIAPVVGPALMRYLGNWSPVASTLLIAVGLAAGIAVYAGLRRGRAARFRTTGTFVGGEDPDSFGRVTGTDFYRTISDMPAVARLSRREEAGAFDVFTAGRRFVAVLTKAVGALHNGILPSYMVWCLLGMVVMFVAFLCS